MTSDSESKGSSPEEPGESPDLSDPLEVLEILKDAILKRPVDRDTAATALKQVLKNYEQQNRVFLIAAANAELPRVVRLMSFIHLCEDMMFSPKRLEAASNKELIRMYALAQAHLLSGLDNVKKVADMRLDALRAAGGAASVEKMFGASDDKELDDIAGLPTLDPQSRDKVRKLVTGLIDSIDKDDAIQDNEEDDDEPADDAAADKE